MVLQAVSVHIGPGRPGGPALLLTPARLRFRVGGHRTVLHEKLVPCWGVEWNDSLAPHWLLSPEENCLYLLPRSVLYCGNKWGTTHAWEFLDKAPDRSAGW